MDTDLRSRGVGAEEAESTVSHGFPALGFHRPHRQDSGSRSDQSKTLTLSIWTRDGLSCLPLWDAAGSGTHKAAPPGGNREGPM